MGGKEGIQGAGACLSGNKVKGPTGCSVHLQAATRERVRAKERGTFMLPAVAPVV